MKQKVKNVLTEISNDFDSVSTIILTGTCMPANEEVFLLMSETTWPILTPNGPRLLPTGGAAVALPPSTRTATVVFANLITFIV